MKHFSFLKKRFTWVILFCSLTGATAVADPDNTNNTSGTDAASQQATIQNVLKALNSAQQNMTSTNQPQQSSPNTAGQSQLPANMMNAGAVQALDHALNNAANTNATTNSVLQNAKTAPAGTASNAAVTTDAADEKPGQIATIYTPQYEEGSLKQYVESQGPVQLISLNFTNIKVRELLQIIAQFTKLNFVINENVKGETSIHLYRVPWTRALDVILKSQNLGERRIGNVIYISTVADLMQQQISELEAKQRMSDLVGLEDRVVRLNYANASDILKVLDTKNFSLLSSRGSTNIDARSNSIWIRDTPDHLNTIVGLIKQLDQPVKQVEIEAKIVSIDRQYERQIGARFGLSRPSHLSGTLNGANQMAQGTPPANVTNTTTNSNEPYGSRLNFDQAATGNMFGSTSTPGSIGLAVAQLGAYFVDLELIGAAEDVGDTDTM
jgi:hypothetical protein